MTPERRRAGRRASDKTTGTERLVVVVLLTGVRLAVVLAVYSLGIHRIINGDAISGIFGVIVGGSGATIAYKLGRGD